MADTATTPGRYDVPPTLGYNQKNEVAIDKFNQWFRSTPQYQRQLAEWGVDPNNVHLAKSQSQQLLKLAQGMGAVVDEGDMEVDPAGNMNPKGHKLRNTLIIAGAAAGAYFAGPAIYSALAGGGGTAGGALAADVGLEAAAGISGGVAGGVGGGVAGAGIGSGLVSGALRYGLPVAGNIASSIIQSKASGAASDAEQKYLEEALAYQKEQDAYARARQERLDEQDKARYGDTRGDIALQQQRDAARTAEEGGRYGDFQNNLAPFIANGVNANSAMASRLGLPATAAWTPNAPRAASSGARYTDPLSVADQATPEDRAKIDALLKKYNSSDNPNYWYGVNVLHGGFDKTGADWNDSRIKIGDGAGKGYAGASTPAPTPAPTDAPKVGAPPAEPDLRTQTPPYRPSVEPERAGDASTAAPSMVTIAAPTGETQQVPESELDHWLQRGAKRVA